MARQCLDLPACLPEPPLWERETWLVEIVGEAPQWCPFCGTGIAVAALQMGGPPPGAVHFRN